jgi:hypothetical protein
MALATFVEVNYPELDLGGMTYWQIGEIDVTSIFPEAFQFIPEIYSRIFDEEISSLPQIHLKFWKTHNQETYWSCKYCSFWCDHFDQRIMEQHLIQRCDRVNQIILSSMSFLTWNRFQILSEDPLEE